MICLLTPPAANMKPRLQENNQAAKPTRIVGHQSPCDLTRLAQHGASISFACDLAEPKYQKDGRQLLSASAQT